MIDPERFVSKLAGLSVNFFTGVPDSLLKPFCAYVMTALPRDQHVIAANEGAAVGLAIGHYLRTGKSALVYMQNSGFGNSINPLISLADPEIYGIPMVLLVGWRGQPGIKDEPQHIKQGRVMTQMLDAMELEWSILPKEQECAERALEKAVQISTENTMPYILLVEKDSFEASNMKKNTLETLLPLPSREEALIALMQAIGSNAIQVSTTGMLSRELFEYRRNNGTNNEKDFLTVGGMGHCSSIALGIAMQEQEREVWCLDGDGALLMHMGGLPVIAQYAPKHYFHVIFNNGVHDSVGGQPTSIDVCNVVELARASGYKTAYTAMSTKDIKAKVADLRQYGGPSLLEIKVCPGHRKDIGRPTHTPQQAKLAVMNAISM